MNKGAILPLFYLPPIEYFNKLGNYKENVVIEKFEHFPKQTYRNRATIASPNGKLDLIVPVVKGSKVQTPYQDVRISYDFKWQRLHWLSLQNFYRSSAFFEYYEHDLAPFYHKKWDFLFDYNLEILELLLKLLKLQAPLQFTTSYETNYPDHDDLRSQMSPKQGAAGQFRKYFQVYEDHQKFIPNLSVLDLLFSQGPQSLDFIACLEE